MAVTYWTVAEVADKLRLHEMTVRKMIWRGDIRAKQLGTRILISDKDLEAALSPVPIRERA